MTSHSFRTLFRPAFQRIASLGALVVACSSHLSAQQTTDETVTLSPFEVRADQDKGYTAASTLSGARLATSLKETPAVIGVLTKEFLDDIMAQNVGQFAEWAPNTFVQGIDGNVNTLQRDLIQPKTRGLVLPT
jgi:outer membrane receptor for ferric coprogen and ferric-rhodotorulic acid